jgi:hypothetical protein
LGKDKNKGKFPFGRSRSKKIAGKLAVAKFPANRVKTPCKQGVPILHDPEQLGVFHNFACVADFEFASKNSHHRVQFTPQQGDKVFFFRGDFAFRVPYELLENLHFIVFYNNAELTAANALNVEMKVGVHAVHPFYRRHLGQGRQKVFGIFDRYFGQFTNIHVESFALWIGGK